MNLYTDNADLDFDKYLEGLMPAVVQDSRTGTVLMLGFMSADSLENTRSSGKVTFFSRSKKRLWTKGEISGNFLNVDEIMVDCDRDTLLIKATPAGPVCHTGSDTCFGETNEVPNFLFALEKVIKDRRANPSDDSYTSRLFAKGLDKIAQKVGEEAVELVIEAKNSNDEQFQGEAADLFYHLLVLLVEKDIQLGSVIGELERRSQPRK
jgi:phosphoribosyl-AMP cyclohydrolase / phosphoribosyl-ATP pyrophosphohydrolase